MDELGKGLLGLCHTFCYPLSLAVILSTWIDTHCQLACARGASALPRLIATVMGPARSLAGAAGAACVRALIALPPRDRADRP
ncbi:hypothetical protein CKO25_08665 [Thiocapsa imhoffii]|uniref:Uncharacterized protein n=1 Tax=Thiocapsa imhoffii TaxID=382777 RepID=A0A9X1B8G1_9GAMM|nr:hypothetical protein [Thiocapsa imhoffii]